MSQYLADRGVDRAPNGDFRPNIPPAVEQATIRTLTAQNLKLRDQVETLEETIRQLREIMRPKVLFTGEWKLSKQEAALLAALYSRPNPSDDQLIEALGRDDFHEHLGSDRVNHLRVAIVHVRRKLEPFGITIHTVRGHGYVLDGENKARVRAGIISAGLVEN